MDSITVYKTLASGEMLNWYRIERILGRGGFGVIYLATDTNLEHQVAIKEYSPGGLSIRRSDQQTSLSSSKGNSDQTLQAGMERFIAEARNLVKFKHPNIVRVMSVFQQNNTAYMVMEFEQGEDLRQYLRNPRNKSEAKLKELIVPVSKGLEAVHRAGFVHRDIKPANILVRDDGSPVLLDFGSARNTSNANLNLTALVSAGYAPLEQYNADSEQQQGPWTDIYALGGALYYAISGSDPVESTRRGTAVFNNAKDPLVPAVYLGADKYSDAFLQAIDWAMQCRIADRPQSLSDWIPALLEDIDQTPDNSVLQRSQIDDTVMEDLSDATVLARSRAQLTTSASIANNPLSTDGALDKVRVKQGRMIGIALSAASLIVGAAGVWYLSGVGKTRLNNTPIATVSDPAMSTEARKKSEVQRLRNLDAADKVEQDKRDAASRTELARQQTAAALVEEQARQQAEAARIEEQARQQAEAARMEEQARQRTEAARIEEQARRQAKAERRKQTELAARKNRQFINALNAAESALESDDLVTAQTSLMLAKSLELNDRRMSSLSLLLERALADKRRVVSDADFDTVTRMFDGLQRAIETKDTVAMDRLAETSNQSDLIKVLMQRFTRLELEIIRVRVHNADKSISATMRIIAMIRENGDRATPSSAYRTRELKSHRTSSGWSKIQW